MPTAPETRRSVPAGCPATITPGGDLIIELRDVTVGYSRHPVLAGLSLKVGRGSFLAVIGPNGGGKTTLLRAICRVLRPSSGQFLLNGQDAATLSQPAIARLVGLVPQTPAGGAGFDYTVLETVLMGRYPHLQGMQRPGLADLAIAEEAMHATGVFELRDRLLGELSGGEAQRVYIARSLAQQPSVLLLDEPTAHLDLGYQAEVMQLLRRLNDGGRGLTIIAVLHDLNLAVQFFDRFVLIGDGAVAATGGFEVIDADLLSRIYRTHVVVERPNGGSIGRIYALPGNTPA